MIIKQFENATAIYTSPVSALYRATDLETGAPVLLKTGESARLGREKQLLRQVDSPYLIKAIAQTSFQGCSCLVLEGCPGTLLSELLAQAPLSVPEFFDVARQLALALGTLHDAGIIHKNVNPSNILYDRQSGRATLLDLGISTIFSYEKITVNTAEDVQGSIAYLSPEQTGRINAVIDYRADFYATGIVFYEMLTGHPPFVLDSPIETIFAHLAKVPPDVRLLAPETPPMLSAVIQKLLSKMAQDRYAGAEGLLHDLKRCQSEAEFVLCEKDFNRHFEFINRLYGRERERLQLTRDYKEVTQGANLLVSVSGYSGVGKTSLVNQIQSDVVQSNGLFLGGKFDQYHRNVPYHAFFEALEQFCEVVLSQSEQQVAQWKARLQPVLEQDSLLLTSRVSRLTLLVDKEGNAQALTPLEERTRFKRLLLDMLGTIAGAEHPLTLFLDDMHLADMGSLELLEELQRSDSLGHIMVIICYRDNEVGENHPLVHSLDKIMRNGGRVTQVHLTGLTVSQITQMVCENFKTTPEQAQPLAKTLHKKTGGNPFYTKQFLRLCHIKGFLYADLQRGCWSWDAQAVQQLPAEENVVDFLLNNMDQIPAGIATLLGAAACIGKSFSLAELGAVQDLTADEMIALLRHAVDLEIIFATSGTAESDAKTRFQFSHDRFQQAFYSKLPPARMAQLHRTLGHRYREQALQEQNYAVRIFEIADHFAQALESVEDPEESLAMQGVLLEAARRCERLSAFDTAQRYLELILARQQILPCGDRDFSTAVLVEYHVALCNLVRIPACDEVYDELCRLIADPVELVDSCCLHITSLSNRGQYKDALWLGMGLLEKLGVAVPTDAIETALGGELNCFYQELAALGEDTIQGLAETTSAQEMAISKLMYRCCAPALFYNPLFSFWLILANARRIFAHGYTAASLQVYSNLLIPLVALAGDYKTAYQAGKAALHLAEQQQYTQATYSIYHLFALHTCHWFEPLENLLPYVRESIRGHAQLGDFEYACFGYFTKMTVILETSDRLEELVGEVEPAISLACKTGNEHSLGTFYSFRQFCKSMRGELTPDGAFDEPGFSEQAHIEQFSNNNMALCYFHILRALAALVYGEYAAALEVCERSAALLPFITGFYPVAMHNILYSLAICKQLEHDDTLPAAQRTQLLATLTANQDWLAQRTGDAPANFLHFYKLVEGERLFAAGEVSAALCSYEEALQAAKARRGLMHAGLVCDMLSRRYAAMGVQSAAEQYAAEAYRHYAQWGAQGACEHLLVRYPHLSAHRSYAHGDGYSLQEGSAHSNTYTAADIDISSVTKASLAIAEELRVEGILKKLVYVLLENAGAQDIYYLNTSDNACEILAEGHVGMEDICVLPHRAATAQDLPLTVIQYVTNALETVILDSAVTSPAYGRDAYIHARACKSILCMPVLSKGELKGVLYLENNLATGVFDQRRKDTLLPIAAQLAISLENAYLYENLCYLVDERTKALQDEIVVRKQAEEHLERMAKLDVLTGLPNRRMFHEILSQMLLTAPQQENILAVLFVDLDGFKAVNDTYGHEKGDVVLVEVAKRLSQSVRKGDTVSRMGGDEFVIILHRIDSQQEAEEVCKRILQAVGQPIPLSDNHIAHVTSSIGISLFPQNGVDAEALVTSADRAMYRAKRNRKNQYVFA